ncbi:MAG: hypothetical protein QXE01_07280 [Sulfolobales archaeon]
MSSWIDVLDLSKISDEDRCRILEYLAGKIGKEKIMEVLGIIRITLWRLLNKQQRVDDGKHA